MYGLMGSTTNVLFLRSCAVATTALARKAIRTCINVMSNMGYEHVFSDTDSAGCIIPNSIVNYSQLHEDHVRINQLVQEQLGSTEYVLEHDELVVKMIIPNIKKSYVQLNRTKSMKDWIRGEETYDEFKIRGVQPSLMTSW
jgi:DNA polymerase elongation subunit (family B)